MKNVRMIFIVAKLKENRTEMSTVGRKTDEKNESKFAILKHCW